MNAQSRRRNSDDRLGYRRRNRDSVRRIRLERLEDRVLLAGPGSGQVAAIDQASSAAGAAGNLQLQSVLSDFGNTLASLESAPTTALFLEAQTDLGNLNKLLNADPALASFATPLQPIVTAASNDNLNGMLSTATSLFDSVAAVLTQEADELFTATLSPSEVDLQPGQGQTLSLLLTDTGGDSESLNLSVGTLPGGVTVQLGQHTVSLAAGASASVSVTLSQTVPSATVFTLDVTAAAPVVSRTASAVVAIRPSVADVLSVTPSPSTVSAGSPVTVTAQVFNTANATRQLQAQLQVLGPLGNVVVTPPPVSFQLSPSNASVAVSLGQVDTTNLAVGLYTLEVSLLASDGSPLQGNSSQATFVVGIPISASVSAAPGLVAPGTSTVTTTVAATGPVSSPSSSNTVDLYFTEYNSVNSINYAPVTYNGTSLTFGSIVPVASNIEADGLIFLPNGNLLTAEGDVTEVNPITGQTQSFSSGPGGDHLALDPTGQFAWTSGQPGELEKIPLNPFSPPIPETLTGDDTLITAVAFDPAGNAYYTTGSPTSPGNFGTINLQTFTTTRVFSDLPAARGIMYDPFSGDIIIVGLSDVTQIDPKTMTIVSTRDFSSLGISKLDQGAVDGQGHLYVADNTGKLLFIDYSQTGLIGASSDFVSAQDFAYHLDDVAPLAGLGASATSFSVVHNLPATGYTVDPTSITPTATSVSSSEIDWMGSLPDNSTGSEQFHVSGSVAGMAPGEVRQISDGTTVTVTFLSAGGQIQAVPIALAPVTVAAEHIISLAPDTQTADLGSETTYTVQLTNPYSTAVTYNLATEGLDGFTVGLASSVTVPAGQTVTIPLDLTIPLTSATVTTGFDVLASTTSGVSDSVEGELTVLPHVALQTRAVSLALGPAEAVCGQGDSVQYQVTVSNVGSVEDTYALSITGLPSGVTATFAQNTIDVPPGATNARTIVLTLSTPTGTASGTISFTLTATSQDDPTVTGSADGTLMVLSEGVRVALSPSSGPPGTPFMMTVINTGTVADSYSLALSGPAAILASLPYDQVTLGPGASSYVPITTSTDASVSPGTMVLIVTAQSQSAAAVEADASVGLTVTAASNPSSPTSTTPTGTDTPPHVKTVQRFGYHAMPTTLVLTFTAPLDPATAQNAKNYKLVGLHGNRIAIKRATYDATAMTVTLRPNHRISVHHPYTLIVRGGSPGSVTDAQGQVLDGDERIVIDSHDLVLGAVTPQFLARYHISRPSRSSVPG
jgi:uncharacterized membrane protein